MAKKDECCPRLEKKEWDKKVHVWKNNVFFYKKHYPAAFYMPIGFGKAVMQSINLLQGKGQFATPPLMVCRNETMWGGDIYVKVKKADPKLPTEKISGKFVSMLFEGDYKNVGTWRKQLEDYCKSKNYAVKEIISHYATCPRCAKEHGGTQTVLFARIE